RPLGTCGAALLGPLRTGGSSARSVLGAKLLEGLPGGVPEAAEAAEPPRGRGRRHNSSRPTASFRCGDAPSPWVMMYLCVTKMAQESVCGDPCDRLQSARYHPSNSQNGDNCLTLPFDGVVPFAANGATTACRMGARSSRRMGATNETPRFHADRV